MARKNLETIEEIREEVETVERLIKALQDRRAAEDEQSSSTDSSDQSDDDDNESTGSSSQNDEEVGDETGLENDGLNDEVGEIDEELYAELMQELDEGFESEEGEDERLALEEKGLEEIDAGESSRKPLTVADNAPSGNVDEVRSVKSIALHREKENVPRSLKRRPDSPSGEIRVVKKRRRSTNQLDEEKRWKDGLVKWEYREDFSWPTGTVCMTRNDAQKAYGLVKKEIETLEYEEKLPSLTPLYSQKRVEELARKKFIAGAYKNAKQKPAGAGLPLVDEAAIKTLTKNMGQKGRKCFWEKSQV